MMELTCAFVVTFVSLVTASPHGYGGVKGGAAAKADATAVAGAFGGGLGALPLAIPSGGTGFTGSFSKSSSSSFASSSASSSASSFSYSSAGSSGVAGSAANSITGANGGCSSGVCQGSGANGAGTQLGSGVSGITGSGGCTSGSCQGNNGLATGLAESSANSIAGNNGAATSGASGSDVKGIETGLSGSGENSLVAGNGANTITAGLSGSGSIGIGNKGVTTGLEANSGAGPDSSDCATSGKCGSQNSGEAGAYSNAGTSGTGELAGYPKTGGQISCLGGDCSSQKIPNCEGSNCDKETYSRNKCTSGDCGSPSLTGSSTDFGSNDIPVNVANSHGTKTSYGLSSQASHDKTGINYGSSGSDCSSGNCAPSSYEKPIYPQPSTNIYPGSSSSNSYNTQATASGNAAASGYNKGVPVSYLTTPKETSVHGSKCTSPNCDSFGGNTNPGIGNLPLNNNIQNPYLNSPSQGKSPICTFGNCDNNQPSATPNYNTNYQSSVLGVKCTTPNCVPNTYESGSSKIPSYLHTPTHEVPSGPSAPSTGTINCSSGNCAGYPTTHINTATDAYPDTKIPSYSQGTIPAYTPLRPTGSSNCATPECAGFTSNRPNVGSPIIPSYTHTSIPSFNTPSAGSTINCQTPGCTGNPSTTAVAGGFGTFNTVAPSGGVAVSNQKAPVYTGGFGGPSGLLKPHEYSSPSKPGYSQQPVLQPVGTVVVPISPVSVVTTIPVSNKPAIISSTYNPSSCTSGNCGSQPGHSSPHYNQVVSASGANAVTGASASSNAASYSGGFGGPPGVLKPYDSGKHEIGGHVGLGDKIDTGAQISGAHENNAADGLYSAYGVDAKSGTKTGLGGQTNFGAKTGASSGINNQGGLGIKGNQASGGCSGDCGDGSSGSSSLGGGASFGIGGGLGLSKTGFLDGSSHGHKLNSAYGGGVSSATQSGIGVQSAGAQIGAVAKATAGASSGDYNQDGLAINGNQAPGGCGGGCGGSSSGSLGGGASFGIGGGLGLSKIGILDGLSHGLNAAGAVAKSVAGAVSGAGAGSIGLGGSFVGSAATAHASSSAATKGGYGR